MADDRRRNVLLGTSSGYAGILVTNLLAVVSIPITLSYFGADRYGAFALVMTMVNYLSVTNFGIPTACAVLASKSVDRRQQMQIVWRSFLLLAGVTISVLALFLLATLHPGWVGVLGRIPAQIGGEVRDAAFWTAVLFLLNLLLAPFLSGFIAMQKVPLERFYATLNGNSYIIALAATIMVQGNLVHYAVLRGALVLLGSLAGALHFLFGFGENRELMKKGFLRLALDVTQEKLAYRAILVLGSRMFVVGLASLVVWQTDNLVISHFLGVGQVTPYQITFKLITMCFIVFTAVNPAISPHYGRAWALGDTAWIDGKYNEIARISSILGGLVWIGSLAFAETVLDLWTGPVAYGGALVVFALGGYGYLLSLVSVHAALLSSLNLVRRLPFISWMEAGVNLLLSLFLVHPLGMGGVAVGSFLASLSTVFWLIPREIDRCTEGKIRLMAAPLAREFLLILAPALAGVLLVNRFIPQLSVRLPVNGGILLAYAGLSYLRLPAPLKSALHQLTAKPLGWVQGKGGGR